MVGGLAARMTKCTVFAETKTIHIYKTCRDKSMAAIPTPIFVTYEKKIPTTHGIPNIQRFLDTANEASDLFHHSEERKE